MKKDLLNEVYRIQELIGVKKNILTETNNPIVKFLSDLGKDFITKSRRTIQGVADEVLVGSVPVEKRVLNDILEVLEDPSLFDAMSNVEKTMFGRILAQSDEIVNDSYKKLFGEFINRQNISEKQLLSKINDELIGDQFNPAKSISEILNDMYGNDPFVTTLLTRKLYDKITAFRAGNFVEELTLKAKAGDEIAQVIKKTGKKLPSLTPSDDINWLNKFASSNVTVFNLIRRSINSALLRYEKKLLGNEEFIQKTFQDILRTTNKINDKLKGKVSDIDSNELLTELRSISSKIKVIQDTFKTDIDALYKEIEEALKTNISDPEIKEMIPEFVEKLKKVDPFAKGSMEEKSYALKFLNNTATQQTTNNIGRIIKNIFVNRKEILTEVKQLASRLPAFLITGAPKTLDDIQGYFIKYGDVRGFVKLTKDIWLATHVGVPLTWATVHTIYNLLLLGFTSALGIERGTTWNDFVTNLEDDFLDQYKGLRGVYDEDEMNLATIAWGLLPGHMYGADFVSWLKEKADAAEKGELRPDEDIPEKLQKILDNNNIPKNVQETLKKEIQTAPSEEEAEKMVNDAIKKSKEGLTKIENSELGFKVFIKTTWIENGKSQLHGNETYTKSGDIYTITQDGQPYNYKWNGKTFEFIP